MSRFPCAVCGQRFEKDHDRDWHAIEEHHGYETPEFKCTHCGAGYHKEHELGQHIASKH